MPPKAHLLSALLFSTTAFAFAPQASAATPTQVEQQQRVQIELAFTSSGGSALEVSAIGDWGSETRLSLKGDEHRHDIRITVRKLGEGDALALKLSYRRDGKTVIKTKKLKASVGATTKVNTPDGRTMVLKLDIAKPKRAPLDLPDEDDPLAGI